MEYRQIFEDMDGQPLMLRKKIREQITDLQETCQGPFKVCVSVYAEAEGEDVIWKPTVRHIGVVVPNQEPKPAPKRRRKKAVEVEPEGEGQ